MLFKVKPTPRRKCERCRCAALALRWLGFIAGAALWLGSDSRAAESVLSLLTNAQQVIDLGMEGARLNPHPVQLRGVITYVAVTHQNWIFVQDDTAGILVTYDSISIPPKAGQSVEVRGIAGAGAFHTYVMDSVVKVVGEAALPPPRQTPPEKLITGVDFGHLVRVIGTIRDLAMSDKRLVIQAQAQAHPFCIWIDGWPGADLPLDWLDAEVEATGLAWTLTDNAGRAYGFRLHVDPHQIRILRPGSTNTFDKPKSTSRELRRLKNTQDARVKLRGVVTLSAPGGDTLYLRDETGPAMAYLLVPIQNEPKSRHGFSDLSGAQFAHRTVPRIAQPGDLIELIGAPSAEGPFAPLLHGCEFRILTNAPLPTPKLISGADGLRPENDGELVRIRTRFVDQDLSRIGPTYLLKFWFQSDGLMFEGRLHTAAAPDVKIPDNSFVEVTGICGTVTGDSRKPRGLRLLSRSPEDIRILRESPPLLTAPAVKALSVAGALILASLAWAWLLRKQVARRTAELRASKSRYEALVEGTSAPVVARTEDGTIAFINRAALRLFGLNENESWVGRPLPAQLYAALQPDGRASVAAEQGFFQQALKAGTTQYEWTARRRDGAELQLAVALTPIELNGRKVFQSVMHDITDRTRRERAQRAIFEISEAVHAADDLDALYARIHEIVKGLMPARNFFLLLHDPAKDRHYYAYHIDEMDSKPPPRKLSGGLNGYVLRRNKSLLVDRESMINPANEWCMVSGTPAAVWLGVPLAVRGRSIGVMAVQDYHDTRAYGDEEERILSFVATQTALAIDRKRSEVALAESETRTRLVIDTALDAVITMDAHGVIRGWNPQAERTFGWAPDDAIGRTLADTIIPPAHREAHTRGMKHFLATGHGPVLNKRIEVTALHRDGHEFQVELAIAPLRVGSTWIFSGFARDITERKRAEARLRESEARFSKAFRASPAMIVITRLADGVFIAANEAFLKISGFTEAEVLGQAASQLNIYAQPHQREEYVQMIRQHGSVRDREHLLRAKDGTVRTVLLSGELLELDGQPHLLSVGLDITGRKRAEVETGKALAREKELGQLKSNFVSMVSHEFRTPLEVILSSADILERYLDRLDVMERLKHVEAIQESVARMAGMMEEVLLLGRFEAGRLHCQPDDLHLASWCRHFVDEMRSASGDQCPIELTLADFDPMVNADEKLLRHILTNLVSNAVKYSQPGIPVRLRVQRKSNDAVFQIVDNGRGIPAEDLPHLFEAFYRARNVDQIPGTGLGLVIVKRCVDLHGGRIECESREGVGTTFTVWLPMFQEGS